MNLALKRISQHTASILIIGAYMYISVPNFLTSIYAEDGQQHLQDAIRDGGIQTLFRTLGGYADLPTRAIASAIYLASPSLYPLLLAAAVVLVIYFCTIVVYKSVNPFFQNKNLTILFISFLIVLPIARFESIGNVANLHFFLFTSSAFVFLHFLWFKKVDKFQLYFVLFSALSIPLMVFFFVFLLYQFRANIKSYKNYRSLLANPFTFLMVGSIINFILSWGDTETRPPKNANSLLKISYLFLDRVVGSSFIPFWGRVSSNENVAVISHSPFQSTLLRATLASAVLIAILFMISKLETELRKFALFTVAMLVLFCILIGRFYNLEPRYCIYPTYLLIFLLFLRFSKLQNRKVHVFIALFIVLLSFNARVETESRQGSTNWQLEVKKARDLCKSNPNLLEVSIQTAPFNSKLQWFLKLSCKQLN